MRICINTSSFPRHKGDYSGAFILELAKSLQKKGHQVWVLCPAVKNSPAKDLIDGVNIIRFRYAPLSKWQVLVGEKPAIPSITKNKLLLLLVPFYIIAQFISLFLLVRRYKIDAINSHWIVPQAAIAVIISKIFKIKHITTLHSTDVFFVNKMPFGRILCKIVDKSSVSTFVVGSFVKERYDKLLAYENNSLILPMGIDHETFKPLDNINPEPFKVLFVGRLHMIKGIKYLLEAISILKKTVPQIKLDIVGTGEEKKNLLDLTKKLELEKNVNFIGAVPHSELPLYYRNALALIVPSLHLPSGETEGLPVVILEAMACGTPVIASNVGSIKDIVKDADNGFLIPSESSEEIASAILKIFSNNRSFRERALEVSSQYYWTNIANVYSEGMNSK